jgi:hypothetical protein
MRKAASAVLGFFAGVALLAGGPAAAEVTIVVHQGRVDLDARSAPLSDVLDRLARQTAMQVTYEGAPPRNLVTATVAAATPAHAVLSVLEGLGVNYAIQLDRTGSEVRTLLLIAPRTGSAAPRPAGGPAEPSPRVPQPPPLDDDDDLMADEDEPAEVRPDRPDRLRPGRERPERPGMFQPGAPSAAVPFPAPGPAPVPAYPVSPFAPVVPPPVQAAPPPPPQQQQPDPDSDGF